MGIRTTPVSRRQLNCRESCFRLCYCQFERMFRYNNNYLYSHMSTPWRTTQIQIKRKKRKQLKACTQRFRYALFAFIHTQTYFEYYTLTLRLASLVKKAVIYAYWTKELFDICRENVSHMATLPSVARHVIHADNLRPRH